MDLLDRYKLLNASYTKVLVYHLGIDTGFFTEYTRMIEAMLFCLEHKIQFRLYSDYANFGYTPAGGWTDYFRPFCLEMHEPFHRKYNLYPMPSWKIIWSEVIKKKDIRLAAWKIKSSFRHFIGSLCAFFVYKKRVLLTHNIHLYHNSSYLFDIPELGLCCDYLHAFRVLSEMVWQMNDETKQQCAKLRSSIFLPLEYVGCQVRGGDKITEVSLVSPSLYVKYIRQYTRSRDVFVLTDDYRLFLQLQSLAPDIHWYTLCSSGEKGYVNSDFTHVKEDGKRSQMLRFLTSVGILIQSSLFIGSITTAPSFYLLKVLYPSNALPIDCLRDDIPCVALLSLKERVAISQSYLKRNL